MAISGEVQAGSARASLAEVEVVDLESGLFGHSPAWEYGEGRVVYLRVRGDSMSPQYPEGCLIAVRPTSRRRLPPGTPTIFTNLDGELSLKLYQDQARRGATVPELYIGVPINPVHQVEFWKPHEGRPTHVVVGHAAYWRGVIERGTVMKDEPTAKPMRKVDP